MCVPRGRSLVRVFGQLMPLAGWMSFHPATPPGVCPFQPFESHTDQAPIFHPSGCPICGQWVLMFGHTLSPQFLPWKRGIATRGSGIGTMGIGMQVWWWG